MKIQNRIIYTSLLILGCTLFAWPHTPGIVCDGQQSFRAPFIIRAQEDDHESEPEATDQDEITPLGNLFPSCNLIFN
ncbi:MAG: hypothetical protein J7578_06505 [Chitinophagaceae bacterium]|nr:hypothetical protein [Chitinophagaceae bacterium]